MTERGIEGSLKLTPVVLVVFVCAALVWMAWPALRAPTDARGRPVVTNDSYNEKNFTPSPSTPDNFIAEERSPAGGHGNVTLGNKAE